MEEHIRPVRIEVPPEIIQEDLTDLSRESNAHTLLIADALFKSFDCFPFLHSLGMKVDFETRCDVLDPAKISQIADACGIIALGLESASYDTLRRMRKVRNWAHYQQYISNARAIFKEAVKHEIPIMVFMIAGYPGDTEKDLEESLVFAEELSKNDGSGGHVFKIGECHVYPKTEIYRLAKSLPDVVFDDDGVFGQNVVRQPSKDLDFETVLGYSRQIFNLSNYAPKLQKTLLDIMPFFRIPSQAFEDKMIPDACYKGPGRAVFDAKREHLVNFRELVPKLTEKYRRWMSDQRSERNLQF
jgi:radical SAM superfamily enzyme YgiQ (UPF0313 family)